MCLYNMRRSRPHLICQVGMRVSTIRLGSLSRLQPSANSSLAEHTHRNAARLSGHCTQPHFAPTTAQNSEGHLQMHVGPLMHFKIGSKWG